MPFVKPPLRQPPPPSPIMSDMVDSLLKTNPTPIAHKENEGGNSVMGRGKRSRLYVNQRCRPYYFRRCKQKRGLFVTDLESLPDELVFEILLHLAAEDIYECAMRVCLKWSRMIHTHDFIYAHLHRSTGGLIMQHIRYLWHPYFMAMVKGRVEISKYNYEFPSLFVSSCNGLILEHRRSVESHFRIANPATNQHFHLPPFPTSSTHDLRCSAIAYDASSRKYKVVCPSVDETSNSSDCLILTVGVDNSWRKIHTAHWPLLTKKLLMQIPMTCDGFLHWSTPLDTPILTLNVETETITETRVPPGFNGKKKMYYLPTGRSITALVPCSRFSWDFWELNKPENGEWVKLAHIDLESRKCKFEELVTESVWSSTPLTLLPVGWLNYPEVLVLHVSQPSRTCVLYSVRSQEIDFLELDIEIFWSIFRFHKSSLVCFDG